MGRSGLCCQGLITSENKSIMSKRDIFVKAEWKSDPGGTLKLLLAPYLFLNTV